MRAGMVDFVSAWTTAWAASIVVLAVLITIPLLKANSTVGRPIREVKRIPDLMLKRASAAAGIRGGAGSGNL